MTDIVDRLRELRLDLHDIGGTGENQQVCDAAADEIEHLRGQCEANAVEYKSLEHLHLVAANRLGSAVGAVIDAGGYCTGPEDITAAIGRLAAERQATIDLYIEQIAVSDALRTAGDRLAELLDQWVTAQTPEDCHDAEAIAAWQTVRGDQ